MGVLSILDEECKYEPYACSYYLIDIFYRFPAATDRTFLEKLEVNHKTTAVFGKELRAKDKFLVRHFAGEVLYDVNGFLDKNRDTLRPELSSLVKKSEISFVKMLFDDGPLVVRESSSPNSGNKISFWYFINQLFSAT